MAPVQLQVEIMSDEDPFSLDFTNLGVSVPDAPSVAEVAATPVAKAAIETKGVPETKAAPIEPAVAVSVAAPAPAAKKKPATPLELVPIEAPPVAEPMLELEAPTPTPSLATIPASSFEKPVEDASLDMPSNLFAEPVSVAPPPPSKSPSQKFLDEIAVRHARGESAEASAQLEAALRAGKLGNATEAGWSMLFDLLQVLNRRAAFETLADAYAKRFEKSAPAWLEQESDAIGLETGGAAYVALSGTLSAASEPALKKLFSISENNPTVRLGLTKVTDADNDGCRLLLETLRQFKKKKRECLISGAEEFAAMLASKIEMMHREREETWLLLLELYLQAGNQELFEDMAVGYAVTFEVSPPSWETPKAAKAAALPVAKRPTKDPFVLEGELLIGMGAVASIVSAAKGKDAITLETERLQRIDEPSAQALHTELSALAAQGLHIRIHGASVLVATLLVQVGLDKIATIEIRRR